MPGLVKPGAGLALRLLSSRAPYGRAGVRFEPSPDRVYGVVEIGVDDLLDGAIAELLADPYVDVSIGPPGGAFLPVADLATFEEIAADMAAALGEMAGNLPSVVIDQVVDAAAGRIEIEQSRDGGPQGDEEAPKSANGEAPAVTEKVATETQQEQPPAPPPPETPAPKAAATKRGKPKS